MEKLLSQNKTFCKTLYKDYEDGGLKNVDIQNKVTS